MSKKSKVGDQEVPIDRRRKTDRREIKVNVAEKVEAMQPPRRKQQRRRQIDPTTCEREYTDPEIQFMQALDAYKRSSGRMFPTCSEILEVIKDLGYIQLNEEERAVIDSIKEVESEMIQATSV